MFAAVIVASIPSPSTAVWNIDLGFVSVPVRAYALCIIAGIVVACIVTDRLMRSRGAPAWSVLDIAMWAVPFGIVGARIYHVFTSPDNYFGRGMDGFVAAIRIWDGGLGIYGGIIGGAFGAWIACRQLRMSFTFVADCMAIGLPLAQAVGRLGNWFNNELYGQPTSLPWGLQVHQMSTGQDGTPVGTAVLGPDGQPLLREGTYHPTFLYEMLWNIGVAGLIFWADRRYKLGKGRAFALYLMAYSVGRAWIEAIRIDESEYFLGVRLNVWIAVVVFIGALVYFVLRRGPQEFLIPAAEGRGFQTVTEAEFRAFQADGTRPTEDQLASAKPEAEAAVKPQRAEADHPTDASAEPEDAEPEEKPEVTTTAKD